MAKRGGSSTIAGIDFEAWFVALKFADAFFDEKIQVKPQAQTYIDPKTQQTEITAIDDIYITFPKKIEFYNLKFRAPNIKSWGISELKTQKVLSDLKEQFLRAPDAYLFFVSQSPCPIFQEVLPRGASCSSRKELEINLNPNKYINDWDNIKKELEFSDDEMIRLSKQIGYKHIIDTTEIKTLINQKLTGHVTNASSAPNCLYQLAIEAGKQGKTIGRDDIITHLEENDIHLKSHLKTEALLEKIHLASASLESISNTFFNDCHIERVEVGKLLNWIKTPLTDNKTPIAVLTGKAGCGKSVILKDLLDKLEEENIPTLGIKADLLIIDSISLLSQELNLVDGIKETLASIVEKFGLAVILIDQIDALSQTLSKDRRTIKAYYHLISQLSLVLNLRIIISCRTYDLQYDPLLHSLEDKYTIQVGDLNEEQIELVLSILNIDKDRIQRTLMVLLKVPLHLKIFSEIYAEQLNLASLTTLQDLYDELWNQRILSAKDNASVIDTIETITKRMDESQSLNVPFALLDKNDAGRQHLLSQSILIKQKNSLHFFHQSFFDYCYARTFLSLHESLIDVVLQQHQGLFVRPQIKQVLTYLRGSDFQKYLGELKAFLTNEGVRFHVWLLVVNQLAFLEDPTDEEWQVVRPLIGTEPNFKWHFIEALQSEQWLNYLIKTGYMQTFIESPDDKFVNLIIWKLGSLINTCTNAVLDFLSNFPSITKKDEYVLSILWRLDHWDDEKAIELFKEKLKGLKVLPDRFRYHHVLRNILPYRPEVVCKVFFDTLKERLSKIKSNDDFDKKTICDYDDIEIFKKLLSWNEEIVLFEALKKVNDLVKKTKYRSTVNFYYDKAFYLFDQFEREIYYHWQLLSVVQEKLKQFAKNDKPKFLKLVKGFQESHSFTLIKLLLQGYLTNPAMYVDEGFRLLTVKGMLVEMTTDESGGYELRNLIREIWPLLTDKRKKTILTIILSVDPDWEKKKQKGKPSWAGYSKYRLLCAIHRDELRDYPQIEKQFYELERRFGKYKEEPPHVSRVEWVGPPLPQKAYEKMTLDQWVTSFKRYDASTGWGQPNKEFLKGGLVEHSRAFAEQVSQRPDEFYDFIFKLGKKADISISYLAAGIDGLVKAEYNIEKVKKLAKAYRKYKDTEFRRRIVWAIEYINKKDTLDLELIDILGEYGLNDPDPSEEMWMVKTSGGTPYYGGDPLEFGINTVRGSAAQILAVHGYKTSYPEKVFEIMEKVADDSSVTVRCCLIKFLHGMLKWDQQKTYDLFTRLTHDKHPQIIKYGLECLSYLLTRDNFHDLIPHLRIAMGIDESYGYHHVGEYMGHILMIVYLRGYPDSRDLLEEGLQTSDKIRAGAIEFACWHLLDQDDEISGKSKKIYLRFLDEESEDIHRKYGWAFREFKPENFNKLFSLIEAYSRSNAVCKDSQYFWEYLMSCVNSESEKCIDLMQNWAKFEKPDIRFNALRGEVPVQVLIGAYNRLIDEKYKEKAMDVFDKILKDEDYKREAFKVLSAQDRE